MRVLEGSLGGMCCDCVLCVIGVEFLICIILGKFLVGIVIVC